MSAVLSGRRMAETQMTLTLAWYAPNGKTTVNEQEAWAFLTKPSTKGKVRGQSQQSAQPYARTVIIGGVQVQVVTGGLHIPTSAIIPVAGERGTGWEAVVTHVGRDDDPALLGRRYLVVNSPAMSHATARRLDVVEVPGANS